MGVFRRYKDRDGNPTGPWFIRYPIKRDGSGKTIYGKMKVGKSKLQAKRMLAKKTAEFEARDSKVHDYLKDLHFGRLLDWYLNYPAAKAKKTYDKDVQRAKVLKEHFGHLRVSRIKPYIIEEYQQKRLGENSFKGTPFKPAMVNREFALLRRIFSLAKRDGLVEQNPCERVCALPERNMRNRILSKDEYRRLIKELCEPARSVVKVAYLTGMRKGEILGLTWDRINPKEGYIDLTGDQTKTGESRRIYLSVELLSIFRELSRVRSIKHNFVFTRNDGEPVKDIRTAFNNACRRAGIEKFVFHDLRHTFNTNMRKAGIDRTVIMDITGHRNTEMFLRYNTVDDYDVREAMERLSNYSEEGSEKSLQKSGTKVEHDENFNQPKKKKGTRNITSPRNH